MQAPAVERDCAAAEALLEYRSFLRADEVEPERLPASGLFKGVDQVRVELRSAARANGPSYRVGVGKRGFPLGRQDSDPVGQPQDMAIQGNGAATEMPPLAVIPVNVMKA